MQGFEQALARRIDGLKAGGLFRALRRVASPQSITVRLGDRTCRNFSSNDYLGFASHETLQEAAVRAIRDYGAGCGAARLICGSLDPHHELEEALAAFKGVEAALTFSSGYAAALGAIPSLVGPPDIVAIDRRVHACVVDAARLSGARLRVFAHNDLDDLEDILRWADRRQPHPPRPRSQVLIVTESVFSMDGDHAPLAELVALKERYGAWLMLDEAHATGLYGPHRRGRAEAAGVAGQIEVQMGTLGKALGAAGGFICGSRQLVDCLINRARSFMFSTAPVPAAAAAATAGVRLVQSQTGEARCAALWTRVQQARRHLPRCRSGSPACSPTLVPDPEPQAGEATSAILPWIVGDETAAVEVAEQLLAIGLLVPAIRYPTVARGTARLRITLSAAHTADDVTYLTEALQKLDAAPLQTRPPDASAGPA